MADGLAGPLMSGAVYPSLAAKRVIVSGGGSGIGSGIVEGFARQGATVGFVDLDAAASETLCEQLAYCERTPVFFQCDITDNTAYENVLSQMIADFGGCDILINNAGNDDRHALADVTENYWDNRIAINLKHMFFASKAVVPHMQAAGGGAIVNLGSISWHLGLENLAVYQTANAAIEGLTRSLARDLGPHNIRVNTIVPGNVQTPRQKKWYTPEGEAEIVAAQCLNGRVQPADIAAMALFLCSTDARFCTGHNYWVDAGWR